MLAVERIFEENMRVMGDSTESAYSHPSIVSNVKRDADDAEKKGIIGVPCGVAFSSQSEPYLTEAPRVLQLLMTCEC